MHHPAMQPLAYVRSTLSICHKAPVEQPPCPDGCQYAKRPDNQKRMAGRIPKARNDGRHADHLTGNRYGLQPQRCVDLFDEHARSSAQVASKEKILKALDELRRHQPHHHNYTHQRGALALCAPGYSAGTGGASNSRCRHPSAQAARTCAPTGIVSVSGLCP